MNFSLQNPYNFKQTSDEDKEKYQVGDYQLIQFPRQFVFDNHTMIIHYGIYAGDEAFSSPK
ncbi:unnamed protein product, partial [Pocillopora meandrina]